MLRRRHFLAGLGGAALSGVGVTLLGREARAEAFGTTPASAEGYVLPAELRAKNVLEVFFFGGLSQFESFLAVPEFGESDGTQSYLHRNSGDLDAAAESCGLEGELFVPFAEDSNGRMVHLGPNTGPLRARADLLARTRICVCAHPAEPHEVAAPLGLAGRALGHPSLSGLGSHIQRHALETETGIRGPYSYVLRTSDPIMNELTRAAYATGAHPANVRPLALQIDAAAQLTDRLARPVVGDQRAAYDALVRVNNERYSNRLRWSGEGAPLRAPSVQQLITAATTVESAAILEAILKPSLFETVAEDRCGVTSPAYATATSIRAAAKLLRHPTSPARHVCVIDGGLVQAPNAGGYDSHTNDCTTQATNLSSALAALVATINEPGENDPDKINLDETMIILHSEFGRTPRGEGEGGRGHWPYAFPVVFLGGPVRGGSRGVYGGYGADARADLAIAPTDHRIAALLALGIWPFHRASFNVGDVSGVVSEAEAAATIIQRVLGVG